MNFIIGIDEVGRGPLAGPVTVCVVSVEENLYKKLKKNRSLPSSGLDSKKILPLDREKYAKTLKALDISFSINHISNKIIDSKGIVFSINRAIENGIDKLKLNPKNCTILLDGGLKAPKKFNQKTIIRGDEKEKIIAWASILAKVNRDALMSRLSRKFIKYGFENHKGYATLEHRNAIKLNGLSVIHRRTFIKFDTLGSI